MIEQVGRDGEVVLTARGDLKAIFAFGTQAVLVHQGLQSMFSHTNTRVAQLAQDAGTTVALACVRLHGLDMNEQRIVAEETTWPRARLACEMCVVSACADLKHPALHGDWLDLPMTLDEGVLHFTTFAMYAVAFPKMSRSILTRVSSALTGVLSALLSWPCRLALTQLNSVSEATPRLLATVAWL